MGASKKRTSMYLSRGAGADPKKGGGLLAEHPPFFQVTK